MYSDNRCRLTNLMVGDGTYLSNRIEVSELFGEDVKVKGKIFKITF